MNLEERARQVNEGGCLIPAAFVIVAFLGGWAWLASPALDAERASVGTAPEVETSTEQVDTTSEEEEISYGRQALNWIGGLLGVYEEYPAPYRKSIAMKGV
jgi:hypothetical protein